MDYPKRKPTRIPGFDYSSQNYYFVTMCTNDKKCLFGQPGILNSFGKIADEYIRKIELIFPGVTIDNYVVMPNHVHMILVVAENNGTNISTVIGQFKAAVTKKFRKIEPNMLVWQRSFHDHIIRNQTAYEKIWNYIEYNDAKWEQDCFYTK